MHMCDEFPELYFPGSDGSFPWDHQEWGDDRPFHLRKKTATSGNNMATVSKEQAYFILQNLDSRIRNSDNSLNNVTSIELACLVYAMNVIKPDTHVAEDKGKVVFEDDDIPF